MGRNKVVMKKIEDPESRKHFYSKRKDGLVKKSNELGVVCHTNIALLMFSPTGEVTTYSRAKSSYEPQVENINNVEEADAYKGYLLGAMERVQRSKEPLGDERFDELNWITMER
uniref:MADS-box domain-containing protein n=1 Tax=Solanum lycopersicum TaxID=4081 RepID=K4C4K7_SOLLC